jgi:hypothetical protein
MENKDDILKKAIDAVNDQPIEIGPPKEVIDKVLEELPQGDHFQLKPKWHGFMKFAAAAVILIACGFLSGRMTSAVDTDRIAQELEIQITENLHKELQKDMIAAFAMVKENLHQDVQSELDRYALQTAAASNMVLNSRLAEFAAALKNVQQQDRYKVANAIQQLEKERIIDDAIIYSELTKTKAKIEALPASFDSNQ